MHLKSSAWSNLIALNYNQQKLFFWTTKSEASDPIRSNYLMIREYQCPRGYFLSSGNSRCDRCDPKCEHCQTQGECAAYERGSGHVSEYEN